MSRSREKGALNRPAPGRIGHRLLVVCEGQVSELQYLKELRQALRLPREQVAVEGPKQADSTDPKGLVDYALRRRREEERKGLAFTDVWCVFDRDQHENYPSASEMASKRGVKLARSNPCFELWVLLHLQEQHAHIERHLLAGMIRKHDTLKDFDKTMPKLFERLNGLLESNGQGETVACTRAETLRAEHKRSFRPQDANPSTEMDLLVKAIRGSPK